MTPAQYPEFCQVIVNSERCYGIWPIDGDLPIPPGWRSTGFAGPLQVALNQVAEQWRATLERTAQAEPGEYQPASRWRRIGIGVRMTHRMLGEEALSTSRGEVPRVEFRTVNDDQPSIRLVFTSSKLRDGQPFQEVAVTFGSVVHFHWSDFCHGILHGNLDDTGFGLLEIADSELVRQLAERDRDLHPLERLHGGRINWEQDVHHYRIKYDGHGMYEVVCFTLGVEFDSY